MNKKGFSLVELIAVIVILGLLAIITTPAYDTVSNNIKTRNYENKKSVIEKQTIEYVENYLKDEVYGGETQNAICFSPNFLIVNGIITSDDSEKEYIENDVTGKRYEGKEPYISISYDIGSYSIEDNMFKLGSLKLKAKFVDEGSLNCNITYK